MYDLHVDSENFINLSLDHLGIEQISLKPIRDRQDPELVARIIDDAMAELDRSGTALLKNGNFYLGSVDFMVSRSGDKKEFFILETNGGSSRGFSIMDPANWEKAYEAVYLAIPKNNANLTILVSYPDKDLVHFEKVFMAEHVKARLTQDGYSTVLMPVKKWLGLPREERRLGDKEAVIICGGYGEIIEHLHLKDSTIYLNDKAIDLALGDGLTRRHPTISKAFMDRADSIKTVVVNPIFHLTDDKSMTYHAVLNAAELVKRRRVVPIKYWRAFNRGQFIQMAAEALDEFDEIVIKPHGGSGGSGIDLITDKSEIEKRLSDSIELYGRKFGSERNPYPYTISRRIDATPADWKGAKHHYDVRIYVARDEENKVRPLGALVRIALEPFTGEFSKKSFVVNLSGYGGVDTSRGLGLSALSLEKCGLDRSDMQDLFVASAEVMAFMANKYDDLSSELRS